MSSPQHDPPVAPGRSSLARGTFAVGKWIVAIPVHFTLVIGLLSACGGEPATPPVAAPTASSTPSSSATTTPTPSLSPTPTPTRTPSPTPTPSPTTATASPTPSPIPSKTPTPTPELSSPAGEALAALTVSKAGSGEDYDRDTQFGDWADPDNNGCDARNDILARDLTNPVSSDGCTITSGTLSDPYTGTTINFERGPATSSDVQIDHVVALGNAWITGADRLTQDKRVALANDPLNLLAVDGPTNGSKSAQDASEWLPPNTSFRCEYVALQIAVKTRYDLFVTAPEKQAMTEVLAGCPDQELPEAGPIPQLPATTPEPPAPEPVEPQPPAPAEPALPGGDVYYENCAAARAAGAAPIYIGQPGYRAGLDRGGEEGVACED